MIQSPSPNGPNGRQSNGRFAKGNPGGPGNPYAQQVAELRSAMLKAISTEDIRRVVEALVAEAKDGNVSAAKELLDRCLGKPQEADLIERIESLEAEIDEEEEVATGA